MAAVEWTSGTDVSRGENSSDGCNRCMNTPAAQCIDSSQSLYRKKHWGDVYAIGFVMAFNTTMQQQFSRLGGDIRVVVTQEQESLLCYLLY